MEKLDRSQIETGPFVSEEYAKTIIAGLEQNWPVVAGVLQAFPGLLVAGGFLRDLAVCDGVKDVDLWTPDRKTAKEVDHWILDNQDAKKSAPLVADTSRWGVDSFVYEGEKVPFWQVIYGYPFRRVTDLIASFDFTVCQIGLAWHGSSAERGLWKFFAEPQWQPDMDDRVLRYNVEAGKASRESNTITPMLGGHAGSLARSWKLAARLGLRIDEESMAHLMQRTVQAMEKQHDYPQRWQSWKKFLEKVEDYNPDGRAWLLAEDEQVGVAPHGG